MKKLSFSIILAYLLCTSFCIFAQSWGITPTNGGGSSVCPGQSYTYKVAIPYKECGCTNYVWSITTGYGSIITGQNTSEVTVKWANKSDEQPYISYTGSNCSNTSTCLTAKATLPVSILSLAGRKPERFIIAGENNNQAIETFSSVVGDIRVLDASVKTMTINYTGDLKTATYYQWQIPQGWTMPNTLATENVRITPDRCSGGVIKVRGVIASCGNPNDAQGFYYSDWLEIPVTRTLPSIATFTASPAQVECGSRNPVSLSASSVAGATNYSWSVPANSGWAFVNMPNPTLTLTTTDPTASLVPTNASGASAAVTVTIQANFGCSASQVATKTVIVGINPIIPAPITQGLPAICEIKQSSLVTVGGGDALTTYDWIASGGVTFVDNGTYTNNISNGGSSVAVQAIGDGAGTVSVVARKNLCGLRSAATVMKFFIGNPTITWLKDEGQCLNPFIHYQTSEIDGATYEWSVSDSRIEIHPYANFCSTWGFNNLEPGESISYSLNCSITTPNCGVRTIARKTTYTRPSIKFCCSRVPCMALIYPNPVVNDLFVELTDITFLSQISSIKIMDNSGNLVVNLSNTKSLANKLVDNKLKIDVSNLTKGTYILHITTPTDIYQQQIIKE
jgi:hypothetical protein